MRSRTRPTVWIGILAMLAQLLLPSVHAAGYAARQGDPLAYAICGLGSPALLAQMREHLPAEVVDSLDRRHAAPDLPDCQLCGAVHGASAAGVPGVIAHGTAGSPEAPPHPARGRHAAHPALPPPARGPPTPA